MKNWACPQTAARPFFEATDMDVSL